MAAVGFVDPSKAGKYPVILSDELLGKESHEIFTGIRYNPKPDKTPSAAKIKPTPSARTNNAYDLIFKDGGIHRYQGSRSTDESQYVLIFDPSREVFVLHRVDSFFNMQAVQKRDMQNSQKDASGSGSAKKKEPGRPRGGRDDKGKKPQQEDGHSLVLPEANPSKSKSKERQKDSDKDDEDSSDDDGGLVMEYPGGQAPASRDFSPAFPQRRFSEFVAQADEEEDDADGEEDDDDISEEHFKLPSPMNDFEAQQENSMARSPVPASAAQESVHERLVEENADADLDLEAELEAELQNAENQSESDVSEED